MAESVPKPPPLAQVAIAARIRALTATPPAPSEGDPPFDQALPNWLLSIVPIGADVLNTNLTVLPLTTAPWTNVESAARVTSDEDALGRRRHRSEATAEAYRPTRLPSHVNRI
jgi:hypothetical protein